MVLDNTEYTCEEALQRLDSYVDRELAEEELTAVRAHLETCAHCAEQFAAEMTVLDAIRQRLRKIPLPIGLSESTSRILRNL